MPANFESFKRVILKKEEKLSVGEWAIYLQFG
jgi:hypothetical protein